MVSELWKVKKINWFEISELKNTSGQLTAFIIEEWISNKPPVAWHISTK